MENVNESRSVKEASVNPPIKKAPGADNHTVDSAKHLKHSINHIQIYLVNRECF